MVKALSTISEIKFINKMKFAKTILNKNLETFVVHISVLETIKWSIYLF